jgi:cobalamin biosynthesis Mg chelatase CobN
VVTSDGRIELQPTQSIALLNGAQTPATMQTTGSSLTVSAADVTFQVDFSVSAGVLSQGSQLTISGEGFQPNTPLVTWLQSSPIKIGESISTGSGDQDLVGSIPADVSAGEHTLQLNGVNAQGHVVSVTYGVTVAASEHSSEQPAWVMPLWLIALAVVLLLAFLVIRSRAARRPVRSKTNN